MRRAGTFNGYVELGVAIWWAAMFRIPRVQNERDYFSDYRAESTRRHFVMRFMAEVRAGHLVMPDACVGGHDR